VRRVGNGEPPLDPELAARLLLRLVKEGEGVARGSRRADSLTRPLTPREMEVLGRMKSGPSNREIAADLVISLGTAKNHVEHIMAKLGISDCTQPVVKALEVVILGLYDVTPS
jgi:DNA-binding NarL/FixJ family response regulator